MLPPLYSLKFIQIYILQRRADFHCIIFNGTLVRNHPHDDLAVSAEQIADFIFFLHLRQFILADAQLINMTINPLLQIFRAVLVHQSPVFH